MLARAPRSQCLGRRLGLGLDMFLSASHVRPSRINPMLAVAAFIWVSFRARWRAEEDLCGAIKALIEPLNANVVRDPDHCWGQPGLGGANHGWTGLLVPRGGVRQPTRKGMLGPCLKNLRT